MNLETKITIYKFTPQLFTLTRLFLSDLQYFAYQESVYGFLLLSNEKTVGT